jgi:two-component system sensor histidine kinase RegB
VEITVSDDGPGFAPGVIDKIGEPYVTMRGRRGGAQEDAPGGLGLGFFIAKTLLERTGADLSLENQAFPASGAVVKVRWRRADLELNLNPEAGAPSDAPEGHEESSALASTRADN